MIPNHILIVGSPHSGKIRVGKHIVGDTPVENIHDDSHSGITMRGKISTKYYSSNVNVLIDEYPASRSDTGTQYFHLSEWVKEFKSPDYKDLHDVINGFIFTLSLNTVSHDYVSKGLDEIMEIKEVIPEAFMVVVGVSDDDKYDYLEVEDMAIERGLEFIYFNEEGQNEFKDKLGKDRLKEVLESHEWTNIETNANEDDFEQRKLDMMKSEMTQGLLDDDKQVDLTHVLEKLKIAKEEAAGLDDEAEKKEYVNSVIEELIDYI